MISSLMFHPLLFILTLYSRHNNFALAETTNLFDSTASTPPEDPSHPSKSYTFTLVNTCPEYQIYLIYSMVTNEGEKKNYQTDRIGTEHTSTFQTIVLPSSSYPSFVTVSYELYSDNHTLLLSQDTMTFYHEHLNIIGMISSSEKGAVVGNGCHPFQYHPSDPSLINKSVLLFLNDGISPRDVFIDKDYYGQVPPTSAEPNSFLQVVHDGDTSFSSSQIKYCHLSPSGSGDRDSLCSKSVLHDPIHIPMGSALLVSHHPSIVVDHVTTPTLLQKTLRSSPSLPLVPQNSLVSIVPAGRTSICLNCDEHLNDDLIENFFWDNGLDAASVLDLFYRSLLLGCFIISGCVGLAFFNKTQNKNSTSSVGDNTLIPTPLPSLVQVQDPCDVLITEAVAVVTSADPLGPSSKILEMKVE
jgi:hypothetical protein